MINFVGQAGLAQCDQPPVLKLNRELLPSQSQRLILGFARQVVSLKRFEKQGIRWLGHAMLSLRRVRFHFAEVR